MYYLELDQLKEINGGAISGTLISAIVKGITFIFELGKALGSGIQKMSTNNLCK